MKVIFLDIDGVLNMMHINTGRDKYGDIFHDHFVNNLRYIIDRTNAKIVISSTWRMSGLTIMKELWEFRNLPGEVIDITTDCPQIEGVEFYDLVERGHEIQEWLDNNVVDNYVIIDDTSDMLKSQEGNFVKTSNNYAHSDHIHGLGLTLECSEEAINILNR